MKMWSGNGFFCYFCLFLEEKGHGLIDFYFCSKVKNVPQGSRNTKQVRGKSPGDVNRHGNMPLWTRLALEVERTGFVNGVSGWGKRERSKKPRLSPSSYMLWFPTTEMGRT